MSDDTSSLARSKNEAEPIYYQDATTLANLVASRQISSREVVQAHLDRIAEVEPDINAIATLRADEILREADEADKAVAAGQALGPLHGIPFTVKDSLDTAGTATQRGSLLFAGFVPDSDSTAVARFKAAGGLVLAKTSLPEFSGGVETDNLLTGRTNNPWDLQRTSGGSSGGDSAALAAGMSPISIGSDVAISLRGPAAFTGVAALKATHGRIPYTGHFPTALSAWWHVGPMARSVNDVALGYSLMSGPDGIDGYAVHDKAVQAPTTRLPGQPVKVGWVSDAAFGPVDPEITAAVADAAQRLSDLGCEVEQVEVPFFKEIDPKATLLALLYGEMVPYYHAVTAGREGELSAAAAPIVAMDAATYSDTRDARADVVNFRSKLAGYFSDYDVLLCPVNPVTARPHGIFELDVAGETVSWDHLMVATAPFNLTGLPALSVPYGFSSENLPIGIQLVSAWFDEATILQLGAMLERRGGLGRRRPPIGH